MDLEWAKALIDQYGYLAVFISTVVEGEVLVIVAAALTASGLMRAEWVILAAAAGAFVGHLICFILGRWRGLQIVEAVPFLRKHYPKVNLLMDEYAHWSVFMFQYLYGLRIPSAIMFGASSVTWLRFFWLQTLNCLSWATLYFFAGNLIGMATIVIHETLGIEGVIIAGLLSLTMLTLLYRHFIHHRLVAFLFHGHPTAQQLESAEGRKAIEAQLPYHIALAARQQHDLSLLLIALPATLKSKTSFEVLAHEVCVRLRDTDIAARIDRSTLAIIAPMTDQEGVNGILSRLARVAGHRLPGTIAVAIPWQSGIEADAMMHAAKLQLEKRRREMYSESNGEERGAQV